MYNSLIMAKRNIKIYFKQKSNLFFSILAVLILVGLHFIVFRKMFSDQWTSIVSKAFPLLEVSSKNIGWLVDSMMFSAIMPIAAFSISLTALGRMTTDKQQNCINDFLVAPIKKNDVLIGYLASSFAIGIAVCTGFLLLFEIYFLIMYGISMSILQIICLLAVTVFSLIFANILMLVVISFVKTEQTLGAVGTIFGTMIGFLGGAFMPVSVLGEGIANTLGMLPFLPLTVLSRQAMFISFDSVMPFSYSEISGELATSFGIEMSIFNTQIPSGGLFFIVLAYTIALALALVLLFKRMKKVS